MVMSIFKSSQWQFTLNWYLVKPDFQFVSCYWSSARFDPKKNHLYLLIHLCFRTNGKFDRTVCTRLMFYYRSNGKFDRTVCTQLMLCYQSDSKFNLKNSLYPAYALLSVKRQVRSKRTVCTFPHDVVIIQQASSIQRNSLYQPFCPCLQPNGQFDPKNSLCLSICLYFQSSVKFDPKNNLYLPICLCFRSSAKFNPKNSLHLSLVLYPLVKWLVRPKEQLVPYFLSPGLSTQSMSTWIPSDMTGSIDSSCLSCIHNQHIA